MSTMKSGNVSLEAEEFVELGGNDIYHVDCALKLGLLSVIIENLGAGQISDCGGGCWESTHTPEHSDCSV